MEDRTFLTALHRQNIKDELKLSKCDYLKSIKIVMYHKLEHEHQQRGLELETEVKRHFASTKDKLYID